ncbi:MAG: DUF72 domain-containing protein [Anaerolineae bacterium]|jgi:uncharacterized protein YecE (DUF72 family)
MDNLLLGTAGWSYADWVGVFYPPGLKPADYLAEYARHFRVVEVDSTFYGTPRPDVVVRWADSTPDDFEFCPKMVRTVTHGKQLVGAEAETDEFLGTLRLLGPKLGPIVLQFDYTFGPEHADDLAQYLQSLPTDLRFAVEVRHRGWLREEFYQILAELDVALVLQDLHYMPRMSVVTTDFTYVRWLGRRQEVSRFDRVIRDRTRELGWWAERVNQWLSQGIRVYAFANNRYQGHAPATIQTFLDQLERLRS